MSKETERAEGDVPSEHSHSRVLVKLLSAEWLASFTKIVKKQVCVDGGGVF